MVGCPVDIVVQLDLRWRSVMKLKTIFLIRQFKNWTSDGVVSVLMKIRECIENKRVCRVTRGEEREK